MTSPVTFQAPPPTVNLVLVAIDL